jgi:hypothetical protein
MAGPICAYDSEAQNITKNFEAVIPHMIALDVDYASGAASLRPTLTRSRLSSTPMRSQARSSRR